MYVYNMNDCSLNGLMHYVCNTWHDLCTGIDLSIYIFLRLLPGIWSDGKSMIILCRGSQLTASCRYGRWYYCRILRVCRPFHRISWGSDQLDRCRLEFPVIYVCIFRLISNELLYSNIRSLMAKMWDHGILIQLHCYWFIVMSWKLLFYCLVICSWYEH